MARRISPPLAHRIDLTYKIIETLGSHTFGQWPGLPGCLLGAVFE